MWLKDGSRTVHRNRVLLEQIDLEVRCLRATSFYLCGSKTLWQQQSWTWSLFSVSHYRHRRELLLAVKLLCMLIEQRTQPVRWSHLRKWVESLYFAFLQSRRASISSYLPAIYIHTKRSNLQTAGTNQEHCRRRDTNYRMVYPVLWLESTEWSVQQLEYLAIACLKLAFYNHQENNK